MERNKNAKNKKKYLISKYIKKTLTNIFSIGNNFNKNYNILMNKNNLQINIIRKIYKKNALFSWNKIFLTL